MDAFIRKPPEEKAQTFKEADERLGIPARIVEKDFWVCWTLRELFALPELRKRLTHRLPTGAKWTLDAAGVEEDSSLQTLLFHYPTEFPDSAGYVRPVVKIEMGARSEIEPAESPKIRPMLAETLPRLFADASFPVRTVAPRRTFWEKAMLLHEETWRPAGKLRKARLSRHYYDLWCLITKGIAAQAMRDDGLFERVAAL